MCGISQRPNHIGNIVTLIEFAQTGRRKSNLLNNKCDGTLVNISICYCEWHTLALITYSYYDEIASLATLGNERCLYFKEEYLFRKLFLLYNSIHPFSLLWIVKSSFFDLVVVVQPKIQYNNRVKSGSMLKI